MCDESGFGVHVPEFYITPSPGLRVPTRKPDGTLEDARPTNGYVYEVWGMRFTVTLFEDGRGSFTHIATGINVCGAGGADFAAAHGLHRLFCVGEEDARKTIEKAEAKWCPQ